MAKLANILQQRFLKKEKPKVTSLMEKVSEGNRSSFSGIFGQREPTEQEKIELQTLLEKYLPSEVTDMSEDLSFLLSITCEVKSITNQAAILHGERIKRAQSILKKYRDGAFSAWLMTTYGNRQTPYNFLQYYDFYCQMPKSLHTQIDLMPRQAIYTLASREGDLTEKQQIIEGYKGETKQELLTHIRQKFPLDEEDKRKENLGDQAQVICKKLQGCLGRSDFSLNSVQKKLLIETLETLLSEIKQRQPKG